MKDYRVSIRLLAPTGTPWQSDTIFGHIAWLVAYGRGGMPIEEFLQPFRAGAPAFVLSDAFPAGYLPRPLYPITPLLWPNSFDPSLVYDAAREAEKSYLVTEEDFQKVRRGELFPFSGLPRPWRRTGMLRASLSRFTETTTGVLIEEGEPLSAEGNLYMSELLVPASGTSIIHLYLRASDTWAEWVADMLHQLAALGFGRDRSVGLGAFQVQGIEPYEGFAPLPDADGFVSLSTYMPARTDPTKGYWRVRLKYGKLGEMAGGGNPFKRPLVQFEPGAVFFTQQAPKPYYGRAVSGVAPGMPEAIQCCYTLAVSCKIPDRFKEDLVRWQRRKRS